MNVKADRRRYFRAVKIATKTLLIMKLAAFFLLVGSLTVSAHGRAQERVTLHLKGVSLETVLDRIQEQTGYGYMFSYKEVHVTRKFDVDVRGATIQAVLDQCLKDLPVTYEVSGKMIKIVNRVTAPVPSVQAEPVPGPCNLVLYVVGEDGTRLAGATVTITGLKVEGVTDEKGILELKNVAAGTYKMQITFVGYQKGEEQVVLKDANQVATVGLKRATAHLDEVQIIAYGQTTQRLSTGNVTTIASNQISEQPVTNALSALEGRVPGMFITQASGMPGSSYAVQIRGLNSISNGNDPFYVIDGVPYSSQLLSNLNPAYGTLSQGNGSPLNFIDPANIESISVLKDADATAIYGSRAANGAVLITTKKGRVGSDRFTVNVSQGIGTAPTSFKWLTTPEFLQMRHEAYANDSVTPAPQDAPDLLVWDTSRYTNWEKYFMGGTAKFTDAQASLAGGSANVQYYFGGSYHRESTVFPGQNSDQKGSFHFNTTLHSNDQKFKGVFSGDYNLDYSNLPSSDPSSQISLPPDAPALYNPDGTLNFAGYSMIYANNPLAYTLMKYLAHTNNLIGNALLSYSIVKGLEAKVSLGYTNLQSNETQTSPIAAVNPAFNPTGGSAFTNNNVHSWIAEPQISYMTVFGLNKISALVGATFNEQVSSGQIIRGSGYTSDNFLNDLQAAPTITVLSQTAADYKYNALFGRLTYSHDDKYLLDLTVRRDGSSRFGPENEFHDFGAAGVAWVFSREHWVAQAAPFLSFGKIRASYGTTGNDQIGDYRYYSLYYVNYYPFQGQTALNPTNLSNPLLGWEATKKAEVALDLGFFKDRVLLGADYFRNTSSDQLVNAPLPSFVGFNAVTENLPATVQNSGWEGTFNTLNVQTGHFWWRSQFNITWSRNILKSFPGLANSTYANLYIIGEPVDVKRLYTSKGVDPASGVYTFVDAKGNTTLTPAQPMDFTSMANIDPKFYGGFRNSLTYRGIQLDFLFQFVSHKGVNPLLESYTPPGFLGHNSPAGVLNRWQAPGDVKAIERFTQAYGSPAWNEYAYALMSNLGYTNASYVRLKNVSMSWDIPRMWLTQAHLQEGRIYVHGQNLWTITKYKGIDPETQSLASLPPLRVVVVGIQMAF